MFYLRLWFIFCSSCRNATEQAFDIASSVPQRSNADRPTARGATNVLTKSRNLVRPSRRLSGVLVGMVRNLGAGPEGRVEVNRSVVGVPVSRDEATPRKRQNPEGQGVGGTYCK